jgi:hypothetical protein
LNGTCSAVRDTSTTQGIDAYDAVIRSYLPVTSNLFANSSVDGSGMIDGVPVVPDRPPPGPVPGALLGAAAGLLLASIWRYGAADVALAVTFVFAGIVAVLVASPAWRRFAVGLLVAAVVAGAGSWATVLR